MSPGARPSWLSHGKPLQDHPNMSRICKPFHHGLDTGAEQRPFKARVIRSARFNPGSPGSCLNRAGFAQESVTAGEMQRVGFISIRSFECFWVLLLHPDPLRCLGVPGVQTEGGTGGCLVACLE